MCACHDDKKQFSFDLLELSVEDGDHNFHILERILEVNHWTTFSSWFVRVFQLRNSERILEDGRMVHDHPAVNAKLGVFDLQDDIAVVEPIF